MPVGIGQEILDVFAERGSIVPIFNLVAGDGSEHVAGDLAGLDTDVLVAVAVEHLDQIGVVRRFRPRQGAVDTGGVLKRQRQPRDHIADRQPIAGIERGKPLGLFHGELRQHRCQSVDHAGPQALEGFGIARLDVQLEPDHRLPRMNVRTDVHRNGIDIHWGILTKASGIYTRTRSHTAAQRDGGYSNMRGDHPQHLSRTDSGASYLTAPRSTGEPSG
jgi:hypothetical protein